MIKIETHCHSKGGSSCGTCTAKEIVEFYKNAGYGGIVLTNHYSQSIVEDYYGAKNDKEGVDRFFSLYDEFEIQAKKEGLKTFFGIEVRINSTQTEYVLYGFDREFLYKNPRLYEYTQKELFELANKNDLFMFQSHPFRDGVVAGDPRYLHGAESFNGHYHHVNRNDFAEKFCEDNNLIKLSGTDFHHDDQPITAGIYIPENINTNKELTDYIRGNDFKRIEDADSYITSLKRHKGDAF